MKTIAATTRIGATTVLPAVAGYTTFAGLRLAGTPIGASVTLGAALGVAAYAIGGRAADSATGRGKDVLATFDQMARFLAKVALGVLAIPVAMGLAFLAARACHYGVGASVLFALIAATLTAASVCALLGDDDREKKVVEGKSLLTPRAVQREFDREAKTRLAKAGNVETFWWGDTTLLLAETLRHLLFIGKTGTGKTTLIQTVEEAILSTFGRNLDRRALINDDKIEALPRIHGIRESLGLRFPIHYIHPYDVRSPAYDIAADVTDDDRAYQLACHLIATNDKNPYWHQVPRAMIKGVIGNFNRAAPRNWSLADLVRAFDSKESLCAVFEQSHRTSHFIPTHLTAEPAASNLISTVQGAVEPLRTAAACFLHAKVKVSVRQFVEEECIWILGNSEVRKEALNALKRLIIACAGEALLSQPNSPTRVSAIMLDEFAKMGGRMPIIDSLLAKGRSKGVAVLLGTQSLSGVAATYGDDLTHDMLGQVSTLAVLSIDPKTAEWVGRMFGKNVLKEITRQHGPHGETTSEHIAERDVVQSGELFSLTPLPGRSGSTAIYVTRKGAFINTVDLTGKLIPPDESVPAFIERDPSEMDLPAWDKDDYERLGITPYEAPEEDEPPQEGLFA